MNEDIARPVMSGTVRPPADMHAAARRDLSAQAYERLMQRTGGAAPTPRQLCEFVEAERAV